jgi:hypothetical protein
VRLLLAKESELQFFRRDCDGFLSEKRIEIGLSPCPDSYRDCFFLFKQKEK